MALSNSDVTRNVSSTVIVIMAVIEYRTVEFIVQ
jgi:hypothetical protein